MKKGTSIIKYVKDKHLRATAKRAFHLWQIRPHEVAPLSNTPCKCACCGTEFVGNFCPRCGQSASVNRFSLKQAIDLFLDVWDVNNRSVFRTMRDMLLRPGYMIRDYLNGMQAGYFSPFKMFFLLATLSLLVEHGFFYSPEAASDNTDIVSEMESAAKGVKELREEKDSLALTSDKVETVSTTNEDNDSISETEKIHKRLDRSSKDPNVQMLHKVGTMISKFADDNPALFTLILLVLFSLSLFVFFRHCPRYPNLRFSEFVAVLICSYNTYTLFMIIVLQHLHALYDHRHPARLHHHQDHCHIDAAGVAAPVLGLLQAPHLWIFGSDVYLLVYPDSRQHRHRHLLPGI